MDKGTLRPKRARFKTFPRKTYEIGDLVTVKFRDGDTASFTAVGQYKNFPVRGGKHSCRPIMAMFRTTVFPSKFTLHGSLWTEWEYTCRSCMGLRRRVARHDVRPSHPICSGCQSIIPAVHDMADLPASRAAEVIGSMIATPARGSLRRRLWDAVSEDNLGVEWGTCE